MGSRAFKHLRLGALLLLVLATLPATGLSFDRLGPITQPEGPAYVSNQVLVTLTPGKTETSLAGMISQYGLTVVRRPKFSHTYVLEIPGTGTPVDQFLGNKDSIIASNPGVQYLSRNYYVYPSDIPNDEFYRPATSPFPTNPGDPPFLYGQWQFWGPNLHIFAPEGWDLEKGKEPVVVAVIDTGVRERYGFDDSGKLNRIIHPDLDGRVLFGIDLADIEEDPDWDPSPSEDPRMGSGGATHGTHVAGIIAAQANNWIGVAGLCWDNVQILPIKVFKDSGLGTVDTVIEGIYYAMWWRGGTTLTGKPIKVNVINMSLGHQYYRVEEEESAVRQAVRQGIVVVCAAGNSWEFGAYAPSYPAAYVESIAVGATQYDDTVTDFTQRGSALDISAPGWDVISTVWFKGYATVDKGADNTPVVFPPPVNGVYPEPDPMPVWPDQFGNTFAYMSGTSMASPHVAAAAALLISHGVPSEDVRTILYETATPRGIGHPNETYGWGLLNVYEALKRASVEVSIISPAKGAVVTTNRPRFRIDLRHADLDTLRVWIDGVDTTGDGIPDNQPTLGGPSPEIANWRDFVYILDEEAGKKYLQFEYTVDPAKAVNGVHTIHATAETDMTLTVPPPPPVDTGQFQVNPQQLGTGWRLFAAPFRLSQPKKPEEMMGNSGMLARWQYATNTSGEYALYSLDGSRTDDEASFTPTSAFANSSVQPLGFAQGTPPAGLGYWLYLPSGSNVAIPDGYGESVAQMPYVISLYYGWNMVGDPFPFTVNWSNVIVEYAGERLMAADAAARGWISNAIFRYDTIDRRYTWKDASSAVMVPWEAEWVKVKIRTPELTPASIEAWSDEFSDDVIDQIEPEPQWFVGNTNGSVLESGGMLRLRGTADLASYTYLTNKDFPIYTDFVIDARLLLSNSSPTLPGGPASGELRFRANQSGIGYSLAFNTGDTPATICLRRSDTKAVIQNMQVTPALATGSVFYANVTAIGTHMKIKVGTFPGRGDVADWELEDSTFSGPGSFWLVNQGMSECSWDYFRYRPVTVRPADVKLIVAPNPYTGAVQ